MSKQFFFTGEELKRGLIGTLEIACFLKHGVARFAKTTDEVMRSFWIVLLTFPLNCSTVLFLSTQNDGMSDLPAPELIYLEAVRVVFVTLFNVLAVYTLCIIHKRLEYFPRCLAGMNWLGIIPAIVETPIHIMVWMGAHTLEDIAPLEMIFLVYTLFISGFFIMHSLNIRWPMAAYVVFLITCVEEITRLTFF
ncbi:MAG: hypothetical protein KDI61_07795 [Alphaproteobacteria bacterium]|nr:hypothetical protein [Alphaproteobacteria bacterium]